MPDLGVLVLISDTEVLPPYETRRTGAVFKRLSFGGCFRKKVSAWQIL